MYELEEMLSYGLSQSAATQGPHAVRGKPGNVGEGPAICGNAFKGWYWPGRIYLIAWRKERDEEFSEKRDMAIQKIHSGKMPAW